MDRGIAPIRERYIQRFISAALQIDPDPVAILAAVDCP